MMGKRYSNQLPDHILNLKVVSGLSCVKIYWHWTCHRFFSINDYWLKNWRAAEENRDEITEWKLTAKKNKSNSRQEPGCNKGVHLPKLPRKRILNTISLSEKLKSREKQKLPSASDIEGAAHGLVRLYSLYQFDVKKFSEEAIISTTLDNGQVVYSEPSLLPVVCKSYLIFIATLGTQVIDIRQTHYKFQAFYDFIRNIGFRISCQ